MNLEQAKKTIEKHKWATELLEDVKEAKRATSRILQDVANVDDEKTRVYMLGADNHLYLAMQQLRDIISELEDTDGQS